MVNAKQSKATKRQRSFPRRRGDARSEVGEDAARKTWPTRGSLRCGPLTCRVPWNAGRCRLSPSFLRSILKASAVFLSQTRADRLTF